MRMAAFFKASMPGKARPEIGDARAAAHAHMGEPGLEAELLDGRHTVPAARNE